jgi:hypothetical protein
MRKLGLVTMSFLLAATLAAAARFPAGKIVRIRLGQTISSASARNGETFDATLAADLAVNGKTIARRGAPVRGRVVDARSSGRLTAPGVLKLRLTSIDGTAVQTGLVARSGQSHKGRNVKAIGGTALAGAVIGALAGGGKGAAIGAGAGAAAGTAGAAATGKKDVRLPAETVLSFTIR